MAKFETLNVAIVGGGPGCKAIMDMIFAHKLSQLRMNLIGVACTNPHAVGFRYAQEKGIYTTQDYRDFYKLEDLHMIIELTGRHDIAEEILKTKPNQLRVMDHVGARLFWDVFRIEENIFKERLKVEEVLKEARDQLENRVSERTSELSEANERLKQEIEVRKEAEQALRMKNRELENFVHVVSHDLRTPIVGVQGFCSRLERKHGEKLDEKGRHYLEQIHSNARRMEDFVADLLSLAKSGQVVSAFEEVDSARIIRDVAARLQTLLKEKDVKLILQDELPTVCCDRKRLTQVFENLMTNAIKFVEPVKEAYIEIGCHDKSDAHQFFVKDNGIGIDPKHHAHVFDLFHRIKDIDDVEGTGVGLAIVKRIVKNHGGKTWVVSGKGEGATFYFTLPKKPCPMQPASQRGIKSL